MYITLPSGSFLRSELCCLPVVQAENPVFIKISGFDSASLYQVSDDVDPAEYQQSFHFLDSKMKKVLVFSKVASRFVHEKSDE